MTLPAVSVLLPVYNCERYIGAAIESILQQSFTDFEFLIVDDGSIDNTPAILATYTDDRIRLFRHANRGLAATLNFGISQSRGRYVARQDQDDLSLPHRLERQVAHLDAHSECVLLGSWAQIIEIDQLSKRFHRHPTHNAELKYGLLFNNPFVHSSVILRRSAVLAAGGYSTDPQRQPPEDYELWSRLARRHEIANLGEVLLHYREVPGSMSRTGISPFLSNVVSFSSENISAASGVSADDQDLVAISKLTHGIPLNQKYKPNFERMKSLLFQAIDSFALGEERTPLKHDAIERINSLKATWSLSKVGLWPLLRHQGFLRSAAKRLWTLRPRSIRIK
ncbi:glycosyltransferase [Cyanobium sp. Morenito 9A2]|uniref:glycosyltransferase family 2 protein n=1 Tax=Cyanobium sp. Morenito 9A2 TaxID=2823718 RepID=UPI0020CCA849|nr:glycosyltransferase [Cyanobium sp. Morenito 9A2]